MIRDGRVLAIVPARGGSKGLPGKNIRPLCGKPLIHWTLEAAQDSAFIDETIVSTDDEAIAQAAAEAGFPPPFIRPATLAGDSSSVVDAVLHTLEMIGGDWRYVVLLQPTSPLRTTADIDAAIEACDQRHAPALVTVSPLNKPQSFLCHVGRDGALSRYDGPGPIQSELLMLNGAVYVIRLSTLLRERSFTPSGTLAQLMSYERAWDIDSLYDFLACEALLPRLMDEAAEPLNAVRR